MLTAYIDGFKRNWWSDKHEYHLEPCYCSVHHRRQLHVRWCDRMWREAQKPESLGVWKVGDKPSSLFPSPHSYGTWGALYAPQRSLGRSPAKIEFGGLKNKTLFLQHFAEPRVRTANKDKDNSQLNQYLSTAFDFPTQCSDACLALHCEETSRTSTARFRTMQQRHWSCHWEATLVGDNFPPELHFDTQATAVGHDTCYW